MLDHIIAEGRRRNYLPAQILAVLCLAIDEHWAQADVNPVMDQLDSLAHPTVDPFYNLAQLRRVAPTDWQSFKKRLYRHLRVANQLLEGTGPLDALTPEEQHQLLEDVRQIRLQLGPRAHESWPSLGLNEDGEELTLRDAFGGMKQDVADIKHLLEN